MATSDTITVPETPTSTASRQLIESVSAAVERELVDRLEKSDAARRCAHVAGLAAGQAAAAALVMAATYEARAA